MSQPSPTDSLLIQVPTGGFDAVIIGAGFAGAWAAKQLCEAGLLVALVDAGPEIDPQSLLRAQNLAAPSPRQNSRRQAVQSLHPTYGRHNHAHFVDDLDNPYTTDGPEGFVWIRGRQVGGRSMTWGGATLRLSDHEFRGPDAADPDVRWPITYDDLSSSYALVEEFLGVTGVCDGVAALPDGTFVTPPPMSIEEERFKRHVESHWGDRRVVSGRGLIADPTRVSIWPALAMQDRVLPAAERTGRLTVRSDSVVSHLVMKPSTNHVDGARCIDRLTGRQFTIHGRAVLLCASTIESVRILLNSRSDRAPAGLGNRSGCLGRFLMDHMATVLLGRIPGTSPADIPPSTGPHGVVIPRFRNLGTRSSEFRGGYGIWGSIGKTTCPDTCELFWSLCGMLEVIPDSRNQILIDPALRDRWNIPAARIAFRYSSNELSMRDDAVQSMLEMSDSLGWRVDQRIDMLPGQFVHELGGARMGNSPSKSVVDPHNRCWEVPNLFVLDGACFPTSGWQNPTLTIMALAVRACRYISSSFLRGEFR